MLRFGVVGGSGRMSSALINELKNDQSCLFSGNFGKHGGTFDSLKDLFDGSDVILDFTTPDLILSCSKYLKNKIYICGTTGLSDDHLNLLKSLSGSAKIFVSSNTSIGVLILNHLLKSITPLLKDFDVEIIEKHHNQKKDSPSGTALLLGKTVAESRGINFEKNACFTRYPDKKRKINEIGFASVRGGSVVGEHVIGFFGDQEVVELTHKAESRNIFAKGAIKIAKMLHLHDLCGFFDSDNIFEILKYE